MRVLVCGDAMLDSYWTGTVSRISPEAPVPVVSVTHEDDRAGGAANVANTIEALGVECARVFGRSADMIRKIRLMAGSHHIARIDFDSPQTQIEPDGAYLSALENCDIVVLVDYGKGSLANIGPLIAAAKGKPILVEPNKATVYSKYSGATMLKPSADSFHSSVGASGFPTVLWTQAASGMTLYCKGEERHFPAENTNPVDVSGAGEAAISAYAAALAKGMPPIECARYASKAAGIACAHQGTYMVKAEELWT